MSQMRPGLGIEFIFQSDFIKDNIRTMRSVIYDIIGRRIILSQPSSDLLRSSQSKDIIVTYIARNEDKKIRYGFKAKIIELMNDYELASGQRGTAVAIKQMTVPEPYEIRRFVRICVPSACGLEMYLSGLKVNLIDISLGGAKFSHHELPSWQPGDRTNVKLRIDEQMYQLDADILRVWSPDGTDGSKSIRLGTLKFVNAGKEVEHTLGKKVFSIERKMLVEGRR